jgi:hypothetical protein
MLLAAIWGEKTSPLMVRQGDMEVSGEAIPLQQFKTAVHYMQSQGMSAPNPASDDDRLVACSNVDSLANDLQSLGINLASDSDTLLSTFTLSDTTAGIQNLTRWWTDVHFGPLADDQPSSWLRAFPRLQRIVFSADGVVSITRNDLTAESLEQATCARKHIEKTTQKLQYLRCNSCGNSVASIEKACCEKRVSNSIESTFRMTGEVVDSVFGQNWVAASAADVEQWLEVHISSTKDRNGKRILPALFMHTPTSQLVQQHVLHLLNTMDPTSARLMTQSCFRSRPFTLMATTFKSKFAESFADSVSLSLSSSCSNAAPSFNSRFGKVIDKQMKWAVRHGILDKTLPEGWSDAAASFGELPYEPLRGVQICQETDALYENHVVEFKTLEAVSFLSKPQHKHECSLSEHVRQMAVSQTLLRASHAGSFLVMIGRDHRILVLEDAGSTDAAGLPRAFAWLKNTLDYWFHPSQPFAAFMRQFAEAVAPYSLKSAQRKQVWDTDHSVDFSGWNFLVSMMSPVLARLIEAKTLAAAETQRRLRR